MIIIIIIIIIVSIATRYNNSPPRPLLAVPNVTAHPSTASAPITVFLHNGPLLCGFNVPIKWLSSVISS